MTSDDLSADAASPLRSAAGASLKKDLAAMASSIVRIGVRTSLSDTCTSRAAASARARVVAITSATRAPTYGISWETSDCAAMTRAGTIKQARRAQMGMHTRSLSPARLSPARIHTVARTA
eukprot:6175312-Pleurochrysis_carterae.AAC.2